MMGVCFLVSSSEQRTHFSVVEPLIHLQVDQSDPTYQGYAPFQRPARQTLVKFQSQLFLLEKVSQQDRPWGFSYITYFLSLSGSWLWMWRDQLSLPTYCLPCHVAMLLLLTLQAKINLPSLSSYQEQEEQHIPNNRDGSQPKVRELLLLKGLTKKCRLFPPCDGRSNHYTPLPSFQNIKSP